MLFYKYDEELWPTLHSFLIYLNYMPSYIEMLDGRIIKASEIEIDKLIFKKLKELDNVGKQV